MTIPEIRQEILRIADLPEGRSIRDTLLRWERELHRRPYVRKAAAENERLTPAKRRAIRWDARANPEMSFQEIAARHNVNPGRVSEALRGKRQ